MAPKSTVLLLISFKNKNITEPKYQCHLILVQCLAVVVASLSTPCHLALYRIMALHKAEQYQIQIFLMHAEESKHVISRPCLDSLNPLDEEIPSLIYLKFVAPIVESVELGTGFRRIRLPSASSSCPIAYPVPSSWITFGGNS